MDSKTDLFVKALTQATEDESFHLQTVEAIRALKIARSILETVPCSMIAIETLSAYLVDSLNTCIRDSTLTYGDQQLSVNRQVLWSTYHVLISSSEFRKEWDEFLHSVIQEQPCAILCQYVTQSLMDTLIIHHFPPESSSKPQSHLDDLSYVEENALRYASGYIVKSVVQEIQRRKHIDERMPLVDTLAEMCQSEVSIQDTSEEWVRSVDRGGLVTINHNAFKFFYSVEMEVQKYVNLTAAVCSTTKELSVQDNVCEDVDVVYNWRVCTSELEDEERVELLNIVVKKYVTIRGFSFAASFMEQYKQQHQKTLQKSKSLRKKISK